MDHHSVAELKSWVQDFCKARDWDPFHSPKDLAIGLITEAAELLEIFRFQTDSQVQELLSHSNGREAIADELADSLFFILRFAARFDFDLSACLQKKLVKTAKKYPVKTS